MRYSLLFLFSITILFSCKDSKQFSYETLQDTFLDTEISKTTQIPVENFVDSNQEQISPKISINQEDFLLQIININLDLDPLDEQVLALKYRDNPRSPIRIAVVDFDTVTNSYKLSWEAETKATNLRTFIIEFNDVVGDLTYDIVCYGIDFEGRQTLDLFWRTTAPQGILLYYKPICNLSVSGTIEIQELERTRAYKLRQKTGKSFPIITYEQDSESQNLMDLVKITYYWDFQVREYVQGDKEKIPGQIVEDQQLKDLYRKGEKEFEEFLSGVWYKTTSNSNAPLELSNLILFDSTNREIIFSSSSTQEVYAWENSFRTLFNSLLVNGSNILVPFIKRQMVIRVQTYNSIQITGSDLWYGNYSKLSEGMYTPLSKTSDETVNLPSISGYYRSDSGDEYFFSPPLFSATLQGGKIKGGFSVYSMGNTILSMKIINELGLVEEERTYKLDFLETTSNNEIKRTLFMIPGTIYVDGFKPSSEGVMKLEQIEIIE